MQSNGGLAGAASFRGKDAILSGPAGGIVGMARTARRRASTGSSASTWAAPRPTCRTSPASSSGSTRPRSRASGMRAPMLSIHTVAAGGGSMLHFADGRYQVGPDSAGAAPGPACYGHGGPLTVTDANVLLGRIQPRYFPQVFGPAGDQPLDAEGDGKEVRGAGRADRRRDRTAAARGGRRRVPGDRRAEHGERDQEDLRPARPRHHQVRAVPRSAARAASTPARSPTRSA